jgi:hypothetical protein
MLNFKITATMLLVMGASAQVLAEEVASSSVAASAPRSINKFSLSSSVGYSTSLHEPSADEKTDSLSADFVPSYKISDSLILGSYFGFAKDLRGEQSLNFNDSRLDLSQKGPELFAGLQSAVALSVAIPLTVESRDRKSLLSSVSVGPRVSRSLDIAPKLALNAQYRLGLTKNIHRYETATTGAVNTSHSLSNRVLLGFDYDAFSLSFDFKHSLGISYLGGARANFETSSELAWSATEALAFAIGLSNSGALYKADGQSSNVTLFDEQSSNIYVQATATF